MCGARPRFTAAGSLPPRTTEVSLQGGELINDSLAICHRAPDAVCPYRERDCCSDRRGLLRRSHVRGITPPARRAAFHSSPSFDRRWRHQTPSQLCWQRRANGHLGGWFGDERPLTVLSAGPHDTDIPLTQQEKAEETHAWNVMQVEQVHLSTRGKQIVVPDSDHMIPYERPDAVVAAIRGGASGVPATCTGARQDAEMASASNAVNVVASTEAPSCLCSEMAARAVCGLSLRLSLERTAAPWRRAG